MWEPYNEESIEQYFEEQVRASQMNMLENASKALEKFTEAIANFAKVKEGK